MKFFALGALTMLLLAGAMGGGIYAANAQFENDYAAEVASRSARAHQSADPQHTAPSDQVAQVTGTAQAMRLR